MRLAACAEMLFPDLPITERVRRIAEAGFDAEIWDWTRHDIEGACRWCPGPRCRARFGYRPRGP
jgi:hydroxypyruvate isomerase